MIVEIQKNGLTPLRKLEQGQWYKTYMDSKERTRPMYFLFKRWNSLEELLDDDSVSKNKGFTAFGEWSPNGIFIDKKTCEIFETTKEEITYVATKWLKSEGFRKGCSYLSVKGYKKIALDDLQPCCHNEVFMGIGFGKLDTLVFDYNKAVIGKLITPKK